MRSEQRRSAGYLWRWGQSVATNLTSSGRATDDVVCRARGILPMSLVTTMPFTSPARSLVSVYVVSMDLVAGRFRLTHRRQLDSLVDLVQRELDIEARNADAPVAHDLFASPFAA